MLKSLFTQKTTIDHSNGDVQLSRRKFLGYAGTAAAITVVATGCTKEEIPGTTNNTADAVDLGSGDIGVLNYAFSLEQLEAAFYIMVINSQVPGLTGIQVARMIEIRDHEISHREFFKNALGSNAIPPLEVDFSSINFNSKDSVLMTAKAFEDLGVSAYNGAGRLLMNPNFLAAAGKIVSVEARHAAWIRDQIEFGSFASEDVVDAMGLDVTRTPKEVLAIASKYLKTQINADNLPNN